MLKTRSVIISASEDRFEKLLEQRIKSSSSEEKEKIDQRIWDLFGEEWAIMFTDMSGFSRGVAKFGIIHFLQTIYESQRILVPVIDKNDGILLKVEGDSFMVLYRNVNKALKAAIEMQQTVKKYNMVTPDEEDILLCIGLGFGRMLKIGDTNVFGPEVNAASKLGEDTAKAWEIIVTGNVKEAAELGNIEFIKTDSAPPGAKEAYKVQYSFENDYSKEDLNS